MQQIEKKVQKPQIFRRGLGLKKEVAAMLTEEYSSRVIDHFRASNFELKLGRFTFRLAREFGFCYGVDRAIDYAYQSRSKFPDKRIFLTGELIHNPHVNKRMLEMGIEFLTGQYANGNSYDIVTKDDVVILPAFGVTIEEMNYLSKIDCILVDTTCGSVLNVWKRVQSYARDQFCSLVHGKWWHEETRATSSQATKFENGHYIVVLDMKETEMVCSYIAGEIDKQEFMTYFKNAVSKGFDPDIHLQHIGCANQTTMLSGESLAIANRVKAEMQKKHGEQELEKHFRSFDTICSATQDRQDAIFELLDNQKIDVMLVIGGYNSSNTSHLVEISGEYTNAFHVDDASCIESTTCIRHKPHDSDKEAQRENWLPEGEIIIGVTAGASTPNNKIGEIVARIALLENIDLDALLIPSSH